MSLTSEIYDESGRLTGGPGNEAERRDQRRLTFNTSDFRRYGERIELVGVETGA